MRVNEVIITRIEGASDSTVSSAISLNDALVEAAAGGALAEIDADILGGERRRRNDKSRYRGRHRCHADAAASGKFHQILPAGRPNKLAISCSRLS
jgi:hypothetical protein